jgi:hypothetical protein
MAASRQAFLRIDQIDSIIDVSDENVVVKMRDGREFSVLAKCAYECWTNIMDVVDPQSDDGPMPPSRDPFIQFSLK